MTRELLGTYTNGIYRHETCGVIVCGPADMSLLVEETHCCTSHWLILVVEVLLALHLAYERTLVDFLEHGIILFVDLYSLVEAEVLGEESLDLLPCYLVVSLAAQSLKLASESTIAALLVGEELEVESISTGAVAHSETACLMVGSDNDESLVGVLEVEVVAELDCTVGSSHLSEGSGSIVRMTRVVDLASYLVHEEEAFLLGILAIEEIDLGTYLIDDGDLILAMVDPVRQVLWLDIAVGLELEEDELVGRSLLCLIVFETAGNGIARVSNYLMQRTKVFLVASSLVEIGTTEEVEARSSKVETNLVVVVAGRLMSILCTWSSMVDADA